MKGFATHFAYEFRSGLRDRSLLLMNYLFPLSFYFIVTLLMKQLNPGFGPNVIPAMVIFTSLTGLILGLPNPLVSARDAGIFRSYRINGVPPLSALLVPALTTAVHTAICAAIVTATAPLLFHAPLPSNWGGFALFILLNIFVTAGLGVLIGVISSNTRMTILWSQAIFLPSIMLGGIMVPQEAVSGALAKVGGLMPSTYSMAFYEALATGKSANGSAVVAFFVLAFTGVAAFILAANLFSWDNQNQSRRHGFWLALAVLVPLIIGTVLM
jgi:ABC-2 type transport system permease protein